MSSTEEKKIEEENNTGKINIKYLAKLAGVAPSTVSRALSNDPKTSPKTIEKITQLAKDLSYYPDSLAKSLREKKTIQ